MIRWKELIRDVVIVVIFTYFGPFIVVLTARTAGSCSVPPGAIFIPAVGGMVMGFAVSGALTKVNRFQHLAQVTVGLWMLSAFYLFIPGIGLVGWMVSGMWLVLWMLIGGGLSFLLVGSPVPALNELPAEYDQTDADHRDRQD